MPKERIQKSDPYGYADLLVGWTKKERRERGPLRQEPGYVELFPVANPFVPEEYLHELAGRHHAPGTPVHTGGIMFNPDRDLAHIFGLEPGESVGPIRIHLDRDKANRLIRVLRTARDETFGRDE